LTSNDNLSGNSHLKIGELPNLRVISSDNLKFHEDPDPHRLLNLIDRLGSEAVLKNPPIVARIKGLNEYIILDGANRITALMKLGFRQIPVQVIKFEDPLLSLHCWNHVIETLDKEYFITNLKNIKGIKISEDSAVSDVGPRFSEKKSDICHLTFKNGEAFYISGGKKITNKVKLLSEITALYLGRQVSDRVSYSNLEHLRKHYKDFTALMTFRRIDKEDFLKIIKAGQRLPAGITRVFLPKRALGLNIPLEFLKAKLTLEDKNRWLDDTILKRVREKSIRFYREPTFVFDE